MKKGKDKAKYTRTNLSRKKKDKNKISGISIYNVENKDKYNNPKGYVGSIDFSPHSQFSHIYTDGKYRYIPTKMLVKLCKEIIRHYEKD